MKEGMNVKKKQNLKMNKRTNEWMNEWINELLLLLAAVCIK